MTLQLGLTLTQDEGTVNITEPRPTRATSGNHAHRRRAMTHVPAHLSAVAILIPSMQPLRHYAELPLLHANRN